MKKEIKEVVSINLTEDEFARIAIHVPIKENLHDNIAIVVKNKLQYPEEGKSKLNAIEDSIAYLKEQLFYNTIAEISKKHAKSEHKNFKADKDNIPKE